jgi:hypothetical protein
MIIQVVIYVTLISSLLSLGALCLHAAFRADDSDSRDSLLLRSLLRCEQQLRDDSRDASINIEGPVKVTIAVSENRTVVWESRRGVLTRHVQKDDVLLATDRFPFPAGTDIEFQRSDSGMVVVRFFEPTNAVVYAKSSDGSTHPSKPDVIAMPARPDGVGQPRTIEIHLRGAP